MGTSTPFSSTDQRVYDLVVKGAVHCRDWISHLVSLRLFLKQNSCCGYGRVTRDPADKRKDISQTHHIGYVAAKSLGHKRNMFYRLGLANLESNTEVPSKIGLGCFHASLGKRGSQQAYLSAESKVGMDLWEQNYAPLSCFKKTEYTKKKVNLQNTICSLGRLEEGKLYILRVFPLKWIFQKDSISGVFLKHTFGYRDPCLF